MDPHAAAELAVAQARAAGDARAALTAVLEAWGGELLDFLRAWHRSDADGDEVFALVTTAAWEGLSRFEGRSGVRTWLYAVARRTSLRYRRDARRRAARFPGLPDGLAEQAARLTTARPTWLGSAVRDRIAALRDALPDEDRLVLMLRVDRGLGWEELVGVLHDPPPTEPAALKREAARLRKRFQLVKERLRSQAEAEGLVAPRAPATAGARRG